MIYSNIIKDLLLKRGKKERELIELLSFMARLALSQVYHTCGNPKCKRCREEGGKHGPFMNAGYRDGKRQKIFYVPVDGWSEAIQAHKSWKRFKELGNEIGDINREILQLKFQDSQRSKRK